MNPIQTRRLTQEAADTYQRAKTGGLFYAASWVLVGWHGGAFQRAPLPSWGLLLAFLGLSVWRVLHRPLKEPAEAASLKRWLNVHWAITLANNGLWGLLFVWTASDPAFGSSHAIALVFTMGLATAMAFAFSMRPSYALAGIALLCVPGLTLMLLGDASQRAYATMMAFYLVYVLLSLLQSHGEYQQRLDLDQELRSQRDLFSQQSRIDSLTELANRRQFADVLAAATDQARRVERPLTLLLLDIDNFKHVNDTHGHAVGDACLVAIAGRLKSSFNGQGELAARVGGEEFGVILEGHDLVSAVQRAERFRMNLMEHPIALEGLVLRMTASLGVAEFDPSRHQDMDPLYQAADSAVYRAKAGGRNRVCQAVKVLAAATLH